MPRGTGSADHRQAGDARTGALARWAGDARIGALANKASGVGRIHLYDEYGNENGAPHLGLFGYTGHIALPGIGLVHMRARAYDPRAERFLSPGPIGYAGGVNLYAYVGGDLVNRTDPLGSTTTRTTNLKTKTL
jgi:RHS repeat-associated protein